MPPPAPACSHRTRTRPAAGAAPADVSIASESGAKFGDIDWVGMGRLWTLAALSLAAACRPTSGAGPSIGDASVAPFAAEGEGSQVELTWRLFETLHWLDGERPRQSAIFELLVDGGTPSRVQLGRRDSSGCVVRDAVDGGPDLATLGCSFAYARVLRVSAGELRIEAFDLDAAHPDDGEPARRNLQTATVRIPVNADVRVSGELARIPDEAVPGTSVR
jgi:hypothetical protein